MPLAEPRLARAVALAHDPEAPPGPDQLDALAERWRPLRSWVAFLLRVQLEDERRAGPAA